MKEIQPFSKTTLAKMAACEALGLSYWSDHPATGCVWAVDDNQQAHAVRWYQKTNEAALVNVVQRPTTYSAWAYPRGGTRVIRDHHGNYFQLTTYDAGDRVKVA